MWFEDRGAVWESYVSSEMNKHAGRYNYFFFFPTSIGMIAHRKNLYLTSAFL